VLLAFAAIGCYSGTDPALDALRVTLDRQLNSQQTEAEIRLNHWRIVYQKQLHQLRREAKIDGDLDTTVTILAEIERFERNAALPKSISELPRLALLQRQLQTQINKTRQIASQRQKLLVGQYDAALDRLQRDRVRTDDLDGAKRVKAERTRATKLLEPTEDKPSEVVTSQPKPSHQSQGRRNQLELRYDFAKLPNGKVLDQSGKERDGTPHGELVATKVNGDQLQAVAFRREKTLIEIGHADLPPPWTVACWLRLDGMDASTCLLDSQRHSIRLGYTGDLRVGITAYGVKDNPFNYAMPLARWVQLAIVTHEDRTDLYVNGAKVSSQKNVVHCPMGSVGRLKASPNGALANLTVWSKTLSAEEINKLFKAEESAFLPSGRDQAGTNASLGSQRSTTR
jgi:hypothetical protein